MLTGEYIGLSERKNYDSMGGGREDVLFMAQASERARTINGFI